MRTLYSFGIFCVTSENGGVRHTMDMTVARHGYALLRGRTRKLISTVPGPLPICLREGANSRNIENGAQHEPAPAETERCRTLPQDRFCPTHRPHLLQVG